LEKITDQMPNTLAQTENFICYPKSSKHDRISSSSITIGAKGVFLTSIINVMFSSLISLLLCILAGIICIRAKIINDEGISAFTEILLKIGLPCTIFVTMLRPFTAELLADILLIFAIFTVVHFYGLALGLLTSKLLRATPSEKSIWTFGIAFGNIGYMGFPIINAVYGEEAMIFTTMANISFNILVFSIGVRLMTPEKGNYTRGEWHKLFITPVMIATILGIICFIFSIRIPEPITDGIGFMASITTPVSMLLIGALLGKNGIRSLFAGWKAYCVLVVKQLVLPLTVLVAIEPIVHNHTVLSVIVLLSAMPSAAITAIFAQKYHMDPEAASRLVFTSTVLSLITVPAITIFL